MIFVFNRIENIVGKGENDVNSIFSFYLNVFKKGFLLKVAKSRDCVVKSLKKKLGLLTSGLTGG